MRRRREMIVAAFGGALLTACLSPPSSGRRDSGAEIGDAAADGADDASVPVSPLLRPWLAATSLPERRDYNAPNAVFANGHLYLIGGYSSDEGAEQTSALYAPVLPDGQVGVWQETAALPAALAASGVAATEGRIYVTGGATAAAATVGVYHAPVNGDGTLGTWTETTPLPVARKGHIAFAADGYLYVTAGEDAGGTMRASSYVAAIEADGSVGAWTTTSALPEARTTSAGAHADGFVYVIGGRGPDGAARSTVFSAEVSAGALGAWTETTPVPNVIDAATAVVHAGHIYLIGGRPADGANAVTDVIHAPLAGLGELGAWTPNQELPGPRARHASAAANGHIYVIGGQGDDDGVHHTSRADAE